MKRSEFLKQLGLGLGVAVTAPALLISKEESNGLSGYGENVFESKSDECDKLDCYFITEDNGMMGPYKIYTGDCLRDCDYCEGPGCQKSRIYENSNF